MEIDDEDQWYFSVWRPGWESRSRLASQRRWQLQAAGFALWKGEQHMDILDNMDNMVNMDSMDNMDTMKNMATLVNIDSMDHC